MIYVVIVYVVFIVWFYIKYWYIPKDESIQEYEKLQELDSPLIGYLENKDGNPVDWILAEILELNRKGYVKIEYEREDVDKYDYVIKRNQNIQISQLKKFESVVYRFLFKEEIWEREQITIDELEERIIKDLGKAKDTEIKSIVIRNCLKEELQKRGYIDELLEKRLKAFNKLHILISLVIIAIFNEISLPLTILYIIESAIIFYIAKEARAFTAKGKRMRNMISNYKKSLQENDILKERKIIHYTMLEKEYSNSIALHIMSEARKEFINDELREVTIRKSISDMTGIIYILIMLLITIFPWVIVS